MCYPWGLLPAQDAPLEVLGEAQGGVPPQDAPLEVPGEAQGDVGCAVIQLPLHLRPAWWADAPQRPGAALDVHRDDILGAVLADELHGQLGAGRHLSGEQPGPPPIPGRHMG